MLSDPLHPPSLKQLWNDKVCNVFGTFQLFWLEIEILTKHHILKRLSAIEFHHQSSDWQRV
jgi:hypothetical protein